MKRLTKYEKENIFLSNAAEDYWSVYINSKPLKRRFKDYNDKHPGILIHEHTDQYGGELFKVPKACVSIRLLTPKTDEQKKKARVYLTIQEICSKLRCGHGKAVRLINELEYHGLIFKQRKGCGKPNKIIVLPSVLGILKTVHKKSDNENSAVLKIGRNI